MTKTKREKNDKKLLQIAALGMKNAYVLWGFRVGAAALAEDGKIYAGCNIESWVSGLGTCAERCAVNHAVLHGNRKIMEVALVMDVGNKNDPRPCGACLQYIHDFAENPEIKIITAKAERGNVLFETAEIMVLGDLLPSPFKK
jgi:cytidine deaminase